MKRSTIILLLAFLLAVICPGIMMASAIISCSQLMAENYFATILSAAIVVVSFLIHKPLASVSDRLYDDAKYAARTEVNVKIEKDKAAEESRKQSLRPGYSRR